MNPSLTLDQVVDIVHDLFRSTTMPRFYDSQNQIAVIREIWIEHCCLPEIPVTSIFNRIITGYMTDEEMGFWRKQALR